jgi:hypothetical protein
VRIREPDPDQELDARRAQWRQAMATALASDGISKRGVRLLVGQ